MSGRRSGRLALVLIVAAVVCSSVPDAGVGQGRRGRDGRQAPQYRYATAFQSRDRSFKSRSRERPPKVERVPQMAPIEPSQCYKDGANLNLQDVRLDFFNTGFKWPQPGGSGSAVTITYSYSNLLNGQLQGLTAAELKQAVEEALSVWAAYAPLHFVEVADSGPVATGADTNYVATGRPHIRFGQHTIDGASGTSLAHAYLPYSDVEGLAGDIHFDRDEDWSGAAGGFFLETLLHEIGHALGLDHEVDVETIMNPIIANRFTGISDAFLLADDIAGIHDIYGVGIGSVTPLEEPDDEPDAMPDDNEPGDEVPEGGVGGVTATVDSESGALVIAGDALDNYVLVTSWWRGTLVWGVDGTTVNGHRGDFFFIHSGDIFSELGSGNDTLKLKSFFCGDSVHCNLGEGDDGLKIAWSWFSTLTATGGDGNDRAERLARCAS